MGPVRVGNDAWRQIQHDVYGSAILAATHVFFDERLTHRGDVALFERLEPLGRRAVAMHDQPDAGLWELRGSTRVHTFSSVMCWAACDRLARIAARLMLAERARQWRGEADRIHAFVDRALLECGARHVRGDGRRPRARREPAAAGRAQFPAGRRPALRRHGHGDRDGDLKRGEFVFRYVETDDFGAPSNAFFVCTFWLVDALAAIGRRDEARALFARLLALPQPRTACWPSTSHPVTGELWGNFVQTYSMVGLINCGDPPVDAVGRRVLISRLAPARSPRAASPARARRTPPSCRRR